MTIDLVASEKEFVTTILKTIEARSFFRDWRRSAGSRGNAWAEIRKAEFASNGKKVSGTELVTGLRNHLTGLQNGCCCYCRRPLQGIGWAKPIEHVLPRASYPRYTFYYRNLAVSCYDCNQIKKDNDWSDWSPSRRSYIAEKRCRKFFHPRYHSYDEHVRYLHVATNEASLSVYFGITDQGKRLCLELLHRSAGRQVALTANPRLDSALMKIRRQAEAMDGDLVAERLDAFLNALEECSAPDI